MNDQENGAHLIGRLILAVADGDIAKTAEAIKDAVALDGDDLQSMLIGVASFAATLAEHALGEDWRNELGAALNGLELNTLEKEI